MRDSSSDGWIYGTKVMYTDLCVCVQLGTMEQEMFPGMLDNYTGIQQC